MTYEEYEKHMAEKYPRYCGELSRFGGYAIGEGWYPIIEQLIAEIDSYTKWRRNQRAYELRRQRAKKHGVEGVLKFMVKAGRTPTDWDIENAENIMNNEQQIPEKVEWVHIDQIKEKFGGLRFYYHGGDSQIHGMVRMAELWAGHSCEKCGNKGTRRQGGWIRTLCDVHEAEYQERNKKMSDEYYA
jgi:hypothetical protein